MLGGCTAPVKSFIKDGKVRVVITGNGFTAEKRIFDIDRGEDLYFEIVTDADKIFSDCVYSGEFNVDGQKGKVAITLKTVNYDERVLIKTYSVNNVIKYYFNGGISGDDGKTDLVSYADNVHLRANTYIAEKVYRSGYTLLGWNTLPDGSGEHIGLGSRVTLNEEGAVELYAEWSKWTSSEKFTYTENTQPERTDDITLISYSGDDDVLSIPAEIEGKQVTCIASGFSRNCTAKILVLPKTIETVESNSFRGSRFKEIYFYDNVIGIYDNSFGGRIAKIHINATVAPRYSTGNDNAQFAEDMDRLILNADRKKMVFFGGCSMSYGLNSEIAEKAFDGVYEICNMGVIGGTNAKFQLDCMTPYIGKGDVFIHAPELTVYQTLNDVDAESRMFVCTESNYDLLSLCDFSDCIGLFNCFTAYNRARMELEEKSYSDFNANYNKYGDIAFHRPNGSGNADFGTEMSFDLSLINDVSLNRLNGVYARFADRGCDVMFSYSPVNANALKGEEIDEKTWEKFDLKLKAGLTDKVKIISDAEDFIMEGHLFYDTDYHLSTQGAAVRTERLIKDIINALGN